MKQHPYWKEPDKIHPDIQDVRDKAKHVETEQEKKLRLAREREELKQERKRERFFRKHGIVAPDPIIEKVNQTEGVRLGRKNAKKIKTEDCIPDRRMWGRISRQSEVQKSGVTAGWNDYSRDFNKAHSPTKKSLNRPGRPNERKRRELEEQKRKLNGVV